MEQIVPLKYLSKFWRTLEISLINCEVNLILTWSENCVIVSTNNANQGATFAINKTKLYVPVVTLSAEDNAKLLQQLKYGFKTIISWNKYLSKPELLARNLDLKNLVEPSFKGINRLFVLICENDTQGTINKRYHLPSVEIEGYNFLIDGKNYFDQTIKNNKVIYENIRTNATGKRDDYTNGCLLDYPYFKENYKMIAIDLSKQQGLGDDPREIQQINFTENLDRAGNTRIFFILEEAKETVLNFS